LVDENLSPPPTIPITHEAARDLDALVKFYESEDPEFLLVRPRSSTDVVYFGGDASAAAYGAGCQMVDGTVLIWMGNWTQSETDRGSNWREAFNLARVFLREIQTGVLDGKEIWMATDNLVYLTLSVI
jgi:sucrose-6-phosphate hydrolase SacC (GH32 family)